MSDLREFRDEFAGHQASTRLDARVVDPYAAPMTVGQAPRGLKLPRPPRLSPEWTILVGLVPFGASLVVGAVGIWWARDKTFASVSDLVGLETIVYLGRTFWTGAGKASMRTLTCSLSIAVIACAPALHYVLGGELWIPLRDVGRLVLGFAAWGALCLAANAVLFAIGSRDVPCRRTRSDRSFRRFMPTVIATGMLLGTSVPFAFRPQMLTIQDIGLDVTPARLLIMGVVLSSALSFMTQTWRWGVRGWRRLAGWRMALFVLASLGSVAPLVLVVIAYYFSDNPPPDGWTPFLVFLVVPIAREIFIRWTGYRAINLYAERWRARKRAVRARSVDSQTAPVPASSEPN